MNRLQSTDPSKATGELAQFFSDIKKKLGMVPNTYAVVGSNAPTILSLVLNTNSALAGGSLSKKDLEAINLAVSENSRCEYCVAAHSMAAKAAGYTKEQVLELRSGRYLTDAKINALLRFVDLLVNKKDILPENELQAVRAAGYSDGQIVEAIAAVSAILFTNMINRANDTSLDFPKPDALPR